MLLDEAQELHGTVGLGHVAVAARTTRLLLVPLHRKGAHGQDWDRLESRIGFYLATRLVPTHDRRLDIHEMRSGRSDSALVTPRSPFSASLTVKPVPERTSRSMPRRSSWSSTTRMRLLMASSSETRRGW